MHTAHTIDVPSQRAYDLAKSKNGSAGVQPPGNRPKITPGTHGDRQRSEAIRTRATARGTTSREGRASHSPQAVAQVGDRARDPPQETRKQRVVPERRIRARPRTVRDIRHPPADGIKSGSVNREGQCERPTARVPIGITSNRPDMPIRHAPPHTYAHHILRAVRRGYTGSHHAASTDDHPHR